MPKPNRRGAAMAAGVAVLATLPYLNTTSNAFVYDDYAQVVRNDLVRSLSPLPSLSQGSVTHGQVEWYRPLTIYSFALNYALGGLRPFLYHVTNIVLHAANSLLVAALVWRLSRSAVVTVTSAALFAVHAVHTEAVTPVFGRADLLSAFFVLAGWCLSLEGPSLPLRRSLTIALLFVAGLLAKESAVALLAVIVVSDLLRANAPERSFSSRLGNLLNQRRGLYVALGLALTGYTLLRFAAVGGVRASGAVTRYIENPLVEAGPLQGVATALWVAAKYVLLFLVPYPLAADYSYRQIPLIQSWTDPRLLALLIAASCAVLVVALWRRAPLAALGLIAFSLLLAPVSNVFFTIGTIMAERVLYLPSVGLCLLAGWAISEGMSRALPWRAATLVLVAFVLVANFWITVLRNRDWQRDETLFAATVRTSPASAKAHFNYASLLSERSDDLEAERLLLRAIQIAPAYPEAHNLLGTILLARNDLSAAEQEFRAAVRDAPGYAPALVNLGMALVRQKRYVEAEPVLKEAVARDASLAAAYANLGLIFEVRGDGEQAAAMYESAFALDPSLEVLRTRARELAGDEAR